jgi:LPS-assembly protein
VDAFIGEGFREKPDKAFAAGSGLTGTATDVVTHFNVTPGRYFDLTSHQRFDHKTWDLTFADAIASAGPEFFRVNAGYLYSPYTPYLYYVTQPTTNTLPGPPRNEISIGANAKYGSWRVAASARKDIQTGKMVSLAANAAYEDECFIFNVQYARRYTSINGDTGSSTLLFTVTLKTVGQFGFHAS